MWRRGADVWVRFETPDKVFSVRLAYNEAERLRHKVGKVMDRVLKEARKVRNVLLCLIVVPALLVCVALRFVLNGRLA